MHFTRAMSRRVGLVRLPGVRHNHPRRTMIPAPGPNTGPLMERRADRELPTINTSRRWLRTFPIFVVAVGAAILGIFNYQKSSSSVVSSTLYALRTSPQAREILGDEIYFAQQIPWISGEMNQLHGRIDISFWVKGTKGQGKMRFRSIRPDRMSFVSWPQFSLTRWKTGFTSFFQEDFVLFQSWSAWLTDPACLSIVPNRGVEPADRGWDGRAIAG